MTELRHYPDHITPPMFSATEFEEYIYVFNNDRSVYRLEYGDVHATWERMTDWTEDHGSEPLAVVTSADSIFLVGASYGWSVSKPSKAISQYTPRSDKWKSLKDKPADTYVSALLCTNEYIYCVGAFSEVGSVVNEIERLDMKKMEWELMPNTKSDRLPIEAAVECSGHIYLTECVREILVIDMYDPTTDQLTELIRVYGMYTPWTMRTFEIEGSLVFVGMDQVHKYKVKKNKFSTVTTYKPAMRIEEAVVAKMSQTVFPQSCARVRPYTSFQNRVHS